MKKVLLATTALAGVSLVAAAGQASDLVSDVQDGSSPVVQSQPAYAVRIAGTLRFSMSWVDQDKDNIMEMSPSYSQFMDTRDLAVIGSATADNGLSYGFNYDVDGEQVSIHMSNRLGRIDLGQTQPAQKGLAVAGSSVMVGRGHYAGGGSKNVEKLIGTDMPWLCRPAAAGGSADGLVKYTTPNYGGLTIAVSYCEEADGNMIDGDSVEDVWSVGGQYTSAYGNYTTVISAGYSQGNSQGKDTTPDDDDTWVWSVGAKVTGMGAGFGISYGEKWVDQVNVTDGDSDHKWFDIAASFSSGPWSISGGAIYSVTDDPASPGTATLDQEQWAYSLSAQYDLAPGLAIMGGVTVWDVENSGGSAAPINHSATTFTLATQASF